MAEGFAVVSGVAGLLTLGLSVCRGVLTYCGSCKDAPVDVEQMREQIGDLEDTLKSLRPLADRRKFGSDIQHGLKRSIESCQEGTRQLMSHLEKIKIPSASDRWHEKAKAQVQRPLYPFKKDTIEKLR